MDLLQGEVVADDAGAHYRVGAAAFPLPRQTARSLAATPAAGIDLGGRAEHVPLAAPDAGVPAVVQVTQPLGPSTVVTAGWEGGTLTARLAGIATVPAGERIGLRLDPAGLLFFDRESGRRLEI